MGLKRIDLKYFAVILPEGADMLTSRVNGNVEVLKAASSVAWL